MNQNTRTRFLIFITHVQILAARTMDVNSSEYAELNKAAEELKKALESVITLFDDAGNATEVDVD